MKTVSRQTRWHWGLDPVKRRAVDCFTSLRSRCKDRGNPKYHRYGGRGIKVLVARKDFIVWYIQRASGRLDLTIDRIDNDGHYEFGNLQLITQSENSKKAYRESEARRSAIRKNGKTMGLTNQISVVVLGVGHPSMRAASFALGLNRNYISNRLKFNNGFMPDGSIIEVC